MEVFFGKKRLLLTYLVSGAFAGIFSYLIPGYSDSIGAAGAITGI